MNTKLCVSSFVVFLLAALAFPATAFAEDDFPLMFSFGLKGGVNMQGGSEVPDLTTEEMQEYGLNPTYPQSEDSGIYGHFGAGPAVGGFFEVRVLDMLGFEAGLFWAQDNATGWEDKLINGQEQGRVSHDLEVTALHIPLLFKANVKNDTIKPFVAVGPEIVIQTSSTITYRADNDASQYPQRFVDGRDGQPGFEQRIVTEPSSYVLLQLNFGMEVDLGEVRIPFEVRTGFNPSFGGEDFDARMETEARDDGYSNFIYDSKFLGHVGIYTGIAYDFDLML